MKIEDFKECINIWIKPETWHTNHPLDTERFHQALNRIFTKNGIKLEPDAFSKLLSQALSEQYPKMNKNFINEQIESAARTYDIIRSYLFDIQK